MAVYTTVDAAQAARVCGEYDLGRLLEFAPIASGIENTNYFATTDRGAYVLTIFERLAWDQLPFYLEFMAHLAAAGLPVPRPQVRPDGRLLTELQGKPAAIVTRLPGEPVMNPSLRHVEQLGQMLARMHLAGQSFPKQQANLRGRTWWVETAAVVRPYLQPEQSNLLDQELAAQAAAADAVAPLPSGPIHADLFRDNVLFEHGRLSGIFDFYFAGCDSYMLDLAICLNDWCVEPETGRLDRTLQQGLLEAYDGVRPRTPRECDLLLLLLRGAALRFWLSRLWDWHLPRPAALLHPHDPGHFERILRCRAAGV